MQSNSILKVINIDDWLQRFSNWCLERPLEKSTINTHMVRIRRTWNFAMANKIIDKNFYPFGKGGFKLFKGVVSKPKAVLTPEELAAFDQLVYDKNDLPKEQVKFYVKSGFILAYCLNGCRVEDLVTLQWSNVSDKLVSYHMKKGG